MAKSKHPFLLGVGVGVVGLLLWRNRGYITALGQKIVHPFRGPLGNALDDRHTLSVGGPAASAIRGIRRYTFAAMQDRSPIVGLTHASYALMGLDLLEEVGGQAAVRAAGFEPAQVRQMITKLQDKHAERLQSADPYISQVLKMERSGFALAGGAPMGA